MTPSCRKLMAVDILGYLFLQKITPTFKILTNGVAPDAVDDFGLE